MSGKWNRLYYYNYFPLEIFFEIFYAKTWHLMQFVFYTTWVLYAKWFPILFAKYDALSFDFMSYLPRFITYLIFCTNTMPAKMNFFFKSARFNHFLATVCTWPSLFKKEYYEWALIIIISHLANYVLLGYLCIWAGGMLCAI